MLEKDPLDRIKIKEILVCPAIFKSFKESIFQDSKFFRAEKKEFIPEIIETLDNSLLESEIDCESSYMQSSLYESSYLQSFKDSLIFGTPTTTQKFKKTIYLAEEIIEEIYEEDFDSCSEDELNTSGILISKLVENRNSKLNLV